MKAKAKVRRIGRFWIDKSLLDEGYRPEDIFEFSTPYIELPELIEPETRRHIGWLKCPECGEQSQIDRFEPACPVCGWNQDKEFVPGGLKCAA